MLATAIKIAIYGIFKSQNIHPILKITIKHTFITSGSALKHVSAITTGHGTRYLE